MAAKTTTNLISDAALLPLRAWYHATVAEIATKNRARFKSGELRGYVSADFAEDGSVPAGPLPFERLETACEVVVSTPSSAAAVLAVSSAAAQHENLADTFRGRGGLTVYGAACYAMAADVLFYARGKGWTRPLPGEEPPSAARKAVRS
jgi:hypothetical protein